MIIAVPAGRLPPEVELAILAATLVLFPFRDSLWGRSPGKALLGLRATRAGRPIGPLGSYAWNSPFLALYTALALIFAELRGLSVVRDRFSVGVMVFFSFLEAVAVTRDRRGHRIGDWLVGTSVLALPPDPCPRERDATPAAVGS